VIIGGIALQSIGFMLIGPSPLLPFGHSSEGPLSLSLLCFALFLFGLGEAMSMTPLMEDMMCAREARDAAAACARRARAPPAAALAARSRRRAPAPGPRSRRLSCVDRKEDAINALSALMTSCFSLGQMVGPLSGSFMASRLGFNWASTAIGLLLGAHTCVLIYLQRQSRPHQDAGFDLCPTLGASDATVPSPQRGVELASLTASAHTRHYPREMVAQSSDDSLTEQDGDEHERIATPRARKWS
jgi:MFS family permease